MDGQVENWGDTWLYSEENKQATTQILVQITKWIGWLNTQGMTNVIMLELVNEPWVFGDMSYVRDWYKASITAIKAENGAPCVCLSRVDGRRGWGCCCLCARHDVRMVMVMGAWEGRGGATPPPPRRCVPGSMAGGWQTRCRC